VTDESSARWMCVIVREQIAEVTRFDDEVDARAYFDTASAQWSESFLTEVVIGPGPRNVHEEAKTQAAVLANLARGERAGIESAANLVRVLAPDLPLLAMSVLALSDPPHAEGPPYRTPGELLEAREDDGLGPPGPEPEPPMYVVVPEDSTTKIAHKLGVSVEALVAANLGCPTVRLMSSGLKVFAALKEHQKLKIPGRG